MLDRSRGTLRLESGVPTFAAIAAAVNASAAAASRVAPGLARRYFRFSATTISSAPQSSTAATAIRPTLIVPVASFMKPRKVGAKKPGPKPIARQLQIDYGPFVTATIPSRRDRSAARA